MCAECIATDIPSMLKAIPIKNKNSFNATLTSTSLAKNSWLFYNLVRLGHSKL
jgi:hypothetical protein